MKTAPIGSLLAVIATMAGSTSTLRDVEEVDTTGAACWGMTPAGRMAPLDLGATVVNAEALATKARTTRQRNLFMVAKVSDSKGYKKL